MSYRVYVNSNYFPSVIPVGGKRTKIRDPDYIATKPPEYNNKDSLWEIATRRGAIALPREEVKEIEWEKE